MREILAGGLILPVFGVLLVASNFIMDDVLNIRRMYDVEEAVFYLTIVSAVFISWGLAALIVKRHDSLISSDTGEVEPS